jgi:ATP-dependent DNA helicase DinG
MSEIPISLSDRTPSLVARRLCLPGVPSLIVRARHALWLSEDGEVEDISHESAAQRLGEVSVMLVHARAVQRRLRVERMAPAYDALELFAFARPARFCLPTLRGLAEACGLSSPVGAAAGDATTDALIPQKAAATLLREIMQADPTDAPPWRRDVGMAWWMGEGGWPWASWVLAALGAPQGLGPEAGRRAVMVWHRLREWQADAPEPSPGHIGVAPVEARRRLADLVGAADKAEDRPQQGDYASAVCAAFAPREQAGVPHVVLAEAGTGVGKTLGYLAPATLWAERNKGPVWISTYTRQLQQQIDKELDRLYPDPEIKNRRVTVRKGRENYLCLLNLEEAAAAAEGQRVYRPAVGLMARWAEASRDGDMVGGDFPGWLADLLGRGRSLGLADRRGECIYNACPHYTRCFVERSVRRARKADIVIANHALAMIQAALGGGDDLHLPSRYVFDEGHHVFDAADSAFAAHLTAAEAAEMRRWLVGAEAGGRSRARGLQRRVEDLVSQDHESRALMTQIQQAARLLPGEAWMQRLLADGVPQGPLEEFLSLVRQQTEARSQGIDGPYNLETAVDPLADGVADAAQALDEALERLAFPLERLAERLAALLDEEAETLDAETRRRIDALARSIKRRTTMSLRGWQAMLRRLTREGDAGSGAVALGDEGEGLVPERRLHVDWFGIERQEGRPSDVGFYRHWLDPTIPFAQSVANHAHGLALTSATLTDGSDDAERRWKAAFLRTGAHRLTPAPMRASVPSPFDYARQTRVLIVNDVRKDELAHVAAAYRELFMASGGGALGLFTAISRLRAVHERIAEPLEQESIPLYAQHLDGMDAPTLVDVFRGEENSCLLGTDAVRDGVDVPGRSLRLIVFDRVPWPRPDLLHKARREHFDRAMGRGGYDDMMTRLRLRQAFGRLVRRADDCGVFVLLDPMMPSRLFSAFPDGLRPQKVGLAEAVAITRDLLHPDQPAVSRSSSMRPS